MKENGYFFNSHTFFPKNKLIVEGEYSYFDGRDEGNRKAIVVFRSGSFVYASPMKENDSLLTKIKRIKEKISA